MTEDFLRRWSRLKHRREQEQAAQKPVGPGPAAARPDAPARPLPPVDKLTPDADFAAFMQPKVEDALRRAALKKLFADPRFNIPDPFEAYSGDWTGGEPIPPEMLATLGQARTLLFDKADEKPAADARKEEQAKEEGAEKEGAENAQAGRKDA